MKKQRGFTLVELMVTVAVVAILAAIAYPSYSSYVNRSKLSEGANALAALQVKMESYYQNTQTYQNGSVCGVPPVNTTNFTITCATNNGGQGYTYTASGTGSVAGTNYTIDEQGNKATTGSSNSACWIITGSEC
ncbi:type IV pilin protein [Pseudomonas gingeri]|uniref:Prepilin-type N-terminal cleavage/methylation domain-containing protein n=1 Tax=Pseudomonas gingeri TaxID=117681 RepID=A0A7Y7WS57_9PSED|nr:type IV pilin protein [Pseudomonas gingeri]NWB85737.1 prepilin-type N-terminal cleavage/methylation domain-containing protein [Pseudomonas gingeri]